MRQAAAKQTFGSCRERCIALVVHGQHRPKHRIFHKKSRKFEIMPYEKSGKRIIIKKMVYRDRYCRKLFREIDLRRK